MIVDVFTAFSMVIVLNDLFSHDRFDQKSSPVGDLGTVGAKKFAHRVAQGKDTDHHGNDGGKHYPRELGTETEHKKGYDYDLCNIGQQKQDIISKKVCQVIDVFGYPDDDLAVGFAVKIVKGQFLKFVEDVFPDRGDDIVPQCTHQPLVRIGDSDLNPGEDHHPGNDKSEGTVFRSHHYFINDLF